MELSAINLLELKELIKKLYLLGDRTTSIILGSAGIGKSEMVKQLAMELASEMGKQYIEYDDGVAKQILSEPSKYFVFVDVRLTEVEPSDLIGIPRDCDGYVAYKPLLWGKVLSECAGILFLDEITNVQRLDIQSAMFKLLLDRRVGFVKLHNDVMVVGAGNRPTDSSIATKLPAPAVNRVRIYLVRQPTVEQWAEYMDRVYGNDWDRRVLAFLLRYRNFFNQQCKDVETLEQYATPRAWTRLASISHKVSQQELEHIAIATVGTEAGSHYQTFAKIKVPSIDELVNTIEQVWQKLDVDERYFVALQLSSYLSENMSLQALNHVAPIINYLITRDRETLAVMLAMLTAEQKKKLYQLSYKHYPQWFEEFKRQFVKVKQI